MGVYGTQRTPLTTNMKCPFQSVRTASLVAVLVFAIAVTCATEDTSTSDKSELSHEKTVHADLDKYDDTDDELVAAGRHERHQESRRHKRHQESRRHESKQHRPVLTKKGVKHMKQIEDFEDYYGPGYSYMNTFYRPYRGFYSYHYPTPYAHVYGSGQSGRMGMFGGGNYGRAMHWNGYGRGHRGRYGQASKKSGKRFRRAKEAEQTELFGMHHPYHNQWRNNIHGYGPYGWGGVRPWKHNGFGGRRFGAVYSKHPYDTKVPYPNIPYRQSYYVPPHFAMGGGMMGGMGGGMGMNAQNYARQMGYGGMPVQKGFPGSMYGGMGKYMQGHGGLRL